MVAMPNFANFQVSAHQVADIFPAAAGINPDTPFIVEWGDKNNQPTLTLRQQVKIETLEGIAALQGAIRIHNRTQGPTVVAVFLQENEDRKLVTSSASQMPRGEIVSWSSMFMRATQGAGWYAVPVKYALEIVGGMQYPAQEASYSSDAVEGRNFGSRQITMEECVLPWSE